MSQQTFSYLVGHLPDPLYPRFRAVAGGDVRLAIRAAHEHLIRTLSSCAPHSLALALRMHFSPEGSDGDPQSRLSVEVIANSVDHRLVQGTFVLIEGSALAYYYNLRAGQPMAVALDSFHATCDVVRDETAIKPLHAPEFNPRIPRAYYVAAPFEARSDNDYLAVDRVLNQIQEPVLIEICLEPTCIQAEQAAHTADMARLQSINRPYEWREELEDLESDPFGSGGIARYQAAGTLHPMQCRDPLADDVLRRRRRFHETLTQPHVTFHMRVFASTPAVAHLLGSIVAECAFAEGSYKLIHSQEGDQVFDDALAAVRDVRTFGFPTHDSLFGRCSTPDAKLSRLGHVATVAELAGAWSLPIASHGSPCCIRKNTDPPSLGRGHMICVGHDDLQSREDSGSSAWRGIPHAQLAKHCAIFGVPGNGKTNSTFDLLLQVFELGTPFLVIETAKKEYRVLKMLNDSEDARARGLAQHLQIFTPGCEPVSPFRHNPLNHHPDVDRDAHIEHLLNCFKAAMPMSGPLPALLGEALERVYDEHSDPTDPPVMKDLYDAASSVLAEKRYSPELASDLRAALEVRLGLFTRRAIGRTFQCGADAPSVSALMAGFSVLELDELPAELKCLLTLFLLTAIREHVRALGPPREMPRFVLVIEEAHNVIGRSGQASASEDNPDPRAFAAEYLCQMLAELRALGVAIVIVDQLPSALAPEVVKNTGSKLTFRQVDAEEREIIGNAMLFGGVEMEEIARLSPGEAYLYTEGYHGPRRIRTPNLTSALGLPGPPSNRELAKLIEGEPWFVEAAVTRAGDELARLRWALDRFDGLKERVHGEIRCVHEQHESMLKRADPASVAEGRKLLARRLQRLHGDLKSAFLELERGPWRNLMGAELPCDASDRGLRGLRTGLANRFGGLLRPQTLALLRLLENLVTRLQRREIDGF